MDEEYRRLEAEARELTLEMERHAAQAALSASMDVTRLERDLAARARKLAALHLALALIRNLRSPEFREREQAFVAALPKRFHSQGTREKTIVLAEGVTVTLEVRYYHRKKQLNFGDASRRGLFPALLLLGLEGGFPPGMRMRMAQAVALLGSYAEARTMLASEGIAVCVNTLRKVTAGLGRVLSKLTQAGAIVPAGTVSGRRIGVSLDGGRVRLREPRKGKTKKGRRRFSPKWREPRMFVIYAVDEQGRQANDFAPIIDGSLGTCDELFALLQTYLAGLKIGEAEQVLFVADGAAWIWRRVPKLIQALGLAESQVRQLIDFWHAVEYLGKLADSKRLRGLARKRWITTQKKRLLRSEVGSVLNDLRTLVGPRPSKNQRTWLNYFITHGQTHGRMDYRASRRLQMPIGSGAVESAIRRVINLRIKSNATYWLRENAQAILRIRSWIKAGRDAELFFQTTCITPQLAL